MAVVDPTDLTSPAFPDREPDPLITSTSHLYMVDTFTALYGCLEESQKLVSELDLNFLKIFSSLTK